MAPVVITIGKPRFRKKLAMFDYDWTLVKPKTGGTFPKDVDDWVWMYPSVPATLQDRYEKGYAIVVFTNQSKQWKLEQIEKVMTEVGVPCTVVVGIQKDEQKPMTIMFEHFVSGKDWDRAKSFFVGDALGRPADFADSDKVFAERVGVKKDHIYAPEAFFEHERGSERKVRIQPSKTQELVIMVGYPGSGKSTLAQTVFKTHGYEVLESDVLKTNAKINASLKKLLLDGKSVVVDATNPSRERRKEYVDIARAVRGEDIKIRCIHVATSMEESVARNNLRPKEKGVPMVAYYTYRKRFEEPNAVIEGFDALEVAGS